MKNMSNEQAIDLLDNLIGMVEDNQNSDYDTALKMGIKALEQESVLDDIRERVELEKLGYPPSAGHYKAIMKVLAILDKYKAESNSEMLVCPACGLEVHSDFKTCPRCGAEMGVEE